MERFESWIKEKGIKSQVDIKETPYAGHGLFSTSALGPESVVVHIPSQLILTPTKVLEDPAFAELIQSYLSDTSPDVPLTTWATTQQKLILRLFLVYSRWINPGPYQPYLDILPSLDFFQRHHVLFNPACLDGTSLGISTRQKLATLTHQWQTLQPYFPGPLERFLWADAVFWSRAVGLDQLALIPFFDFANHGPATIRWEPQPDGLDLITTQDVESGQELVLSYGDKPNGEWLFLHGFCLENNPIKSWFTLRLETDPHKLAWFRKAKVNMLRLVGGDEDWRCGWDEDSMSAMYLVALQEEDGLSVERWEIGGRPIETLEDVKEAVEALEILPVIRLRVVILLCQALEFHYERITDFDPESVSSPIEEQAFVYRQEEVQTIIEGINALRAMQEKLQQHPVVLAYLESIQNES